MSLKWKELELAILEARTVLVGAVLQKIAQADAAYGGGDNFLLSGFAPARGPWRYWISLYQNFCCAALAGPEGKFPTADKPSHFAMILRKHILGQEIVALEQYGKDRIFFLCFANGLRLLVELVPNRGNMLLLSDWRDGDRSGICMASYRKVSLEPGARYITLPPPNTLNAEIRSDWLDVSERAGKKNSTSFNQAIYTHYRDFIGETKFQQQKRAQAQIVKGALKKTQQALAKNAAELKEAEEAEECRKNGTALVGKLYELGPKEFPRAAIIEIEGRKINLDRSKSYAENAENFFRKSKKYDRAVDELEKRRAEIADRVSALEAIAVAIEKASDETALKAIAPRFSDLGISAEGGVQKQGAKGKRAGAEARPFLEVKSSDGFLIYCGRNQEENRRVTFQEAKGSDTWLHLRGVPGAHVVIKAQKNKTVPLNTLLEAAQITLYYSKVRDGKKAEVDYTQRKYVKAIKGTLAEVTYTENKTLYVEADAALLRKLMQSI